MVNVFLVDDREIVRRGVRELVDAETDLAVVGEAGSCAQARARIPALRPDIAVLDIRLPDGDGIALCRDLLVSRPGMKCLILTSFADEQAMLAAVLAGAGGFVPEDIRGPELVGAIRDVGAGRMLLDQRASAAVLARLRTPAAAAGDPLEALTARERMLLAHIRDGLTNREIAARVFLSEKTVKNYVSRLLAKLEVERRTQAAVLAAQLELPACDPA
ncbi:response regulator [Nocardia sp. NPDC020380]|uniref:response regulator n=1 Tax=Nocardia sp. NPDC020380 TaxID=3364309 RepID=UPI0037A5D7C1